MLNLGFSQCGPYTDGRCVIVQAKLLEHNVRFGDPECQGLMLRLESDLLEVLLAACDGKLEGVQLKWSSDTALTVVMAAKGYPGSYQKGTIIHNLDQVATAKVISCMYCCVRLGSLFDSQQ